MAYESGACIPIMYNTRVLIVLPVRMLYVRAALEMLFDKNNSKASAFFEHTRTDRSEAPENNSFTLLRRISGDVFGMKTRSGESSDFEISVFRRLKQFPSVQEL
jgi:hypothetical protein